MKLVELKVDVKTVLETVKADLERLTAIEITDTTELKKKLNELETALSVAKQLKMDTAPIEAEIKQIKAKLEQSEVKLTKKQKALLKYLELKGLVEVSVKKSGGKSVRKLYYITENGIKEFNSFGALQRELGIQSGDNNPKRVILRWLQKTAPKCAVIADKELVYAHPDIKPELYQKFLE